MKHLNSETFNEALKSSKPVLIEFSAPWCTYCRRIETAMAAVAAEQADYLDVYAVNIDNNPELVNAYSVELVPTLMLFKNGQVVDNVVAPGSKAEIEAFLSNKVTLHSGGTHIYDMAVIGGGPGGYTAALYAARAGLDTVVIEKLSAGGQMAETQNIENYPGFAEGVDGLTLGLSMQAQAERFGVVTKLSEVESVNLTEPVKTIKTSEGMISARTVVIATGAGHKHLGIENEEALIGRGVGYCATCDGMFFRGKTVAVVGGGNSAAADALFLSRIAKKVYVIHRRDALRATKVYHQPLMETENVEFLWNSTVSKLLFEQKLTGVKLQNTLTGEQSQLELDGLFISIGRTPATELFKNQVELDETGYIIADETTKTNLPGVFAVGDVRTKPMRQVVTAVADGAVATHFAEEYLSAL
ncbi:MAG: thioredoxin-disulfide reductase [Oscillospiraceae bacterium]|nr:thioredoxin-disulfide reductase [Oscillospiraceae bacterium]